MTTRLNVFSKSRCWIFFFFFPAICTCSGKNRWDSVASPSLWFGACLDIVSPDFLNNSTAKLPKRRQLHFRQRVMWNSCHWVPFHCHGCRQKSWHSPYTSVGWRWGVCFPESLSWISWGFCRYSRSQRRVLSCHPPLRGPPSHHFLRTLHSLSSSQFTPSLTGRTATILSWSKEENWIQVPN